MPIRCFWPPLRLRIRSSRFSGSPTSSSSSSTRSRISPLGVPQTSRGKATFSKTFFRLIRLKFWKIIPISRRSPFSSSEPRSRTSRPMTRTLPSSYRSSPFRQRSRVDFPAPECPTMPKTSPLRTERETSRSTVSSPKRFVRPSTRRISSARPAPAVSRPSSRSLALMRSLPLSLRPGASPQKKAGTPKGPGPEERPRQRSIAGRLRVGPAMHRHHHHDGGGVSETIVHRDSSFPRS